MAQCYANPTPIFQPAMRLIASITRSNPATVTTTFNHQYINGTVVRLDIPPACGMQQANGQTGAISVTSATAFTIDIDTRLFEPFVLPVDGSLSPVIDTCAQVVPIGEINSTLKAATVNSLNPS